MPHLEEHPQPIMVMTSIQVSVSDVIVDPISIQYAPSCAWTGVVPIGICEVSG